MITYTSTLTERQKQDIWALLCAADGEFVPPLSARTQTTQAHLSGGKAQSAPQAYFEGLLKQSFLLAEEDGAVVGFLSFIPVRRDLGFACNYISTIIVEKSHRNRGITSQMYRKLFEISGNTPIATRTWSQNAAHIALLGKLGFREHSRIPNDRGEGVDTVYFVRKGD